MRAGLASAACAGSFANFNCVVAAQRPSVYLRKNYLSLIAGFVGFCGGHVQQRLRRGPKKETAGQYTDDKTITARVKTALLADPDVKGTQVNVTTFKGVVPLIGFVENTTRKSRASEIARSVKGVQEVRNDLILPTGR